MMWLGHMVKWLHFVVTAVEQNVNQLLRGHYYLLQSGDDHSRGPLKKKAKTASGGGSKLKKKWNIYVYKMI